MYSPSFLRQIQKTQFYHEIEANFYKKTMMEMWVGEKRLPMSLKIFMPLFREYRTVDRAGHRVREKSEAQERSRWLG